MPEKAQIELMEGESPKTQKGLSRREFLKGSVAATAFVAAVATGCSRLAPTVTTTVTATPSVTPPPTMTPSVASPVFDALQFFNRNEAAIVHAAAGRIIPGTVQDPGAKEAGAVVFIDQALEGYDLPLQPQYQAGVPGLEAYAQAKYAKGFADLSDQQQDDILSNLEKNSDEAKKYLPAPATFFATLLTHTRQGMFADPIYGGNRNAVGWKLEGHPGIVFGHPTAEQACNIDVPKEYMGAQQYYAGHTA